MKMVEDILQIPLSQVLARHPIVTDFLDVFSIAPVQGKQTFIDAIGGYSDEFWEDHGTTRQELIDNFVAFFSGLVDARTQQKIESLEVLPGINKKGEAEACSLLLKPGEVTCIVGPTGSGKSRLLADIEWLASGDTPTKRTVLLNGKAPTEALKNRFGGKLISQITQNMNFVLDMDVQSFLLLHAQSRFLQDPEQRVAEVIELANELSGESFTAKTPVTFLSGGQSRALMIADVACIGLAPIVLIDEIENAGVDKAKALELLVNQDKVVLMATHDPLLILRADKRVVIKNGGMHKILHTSELEKDFYLELVAIDDTMQRARNFLRSGSSL